MIALQRVGYKRKACFIQETGFSFALDPVIAH
jgi:hypothetical protein